MTDSRRLKVLFRADKSGDFKGSVTAVFPEVSEGHGLVTCYAHVGQHSACSREWYYTTRPAKPEEYADLKRELEQIGYLLDVRMRARWVSGF